jgi:SAM-dependent methyltransferase
MSTPPPADPVVDPYDEIAYSSVPFPQTHPDRLAVLARLHGLAPAPVERCRVLDLGCGDGANVIPIALGLPDAHVVGVDRAAGAIAKGQQTIEALGLRNIRLRCADLLDLAHEKPAPEEQFDYIVAHGVYSWVPPDVREALLSVMRTWLAPEGVAFVSYNAYPGGHQRQAVGEILRYHTADAESPRVAIERAQELARLLADALSPSEENAALRVGMRAIGTRQPGGLFHDELAAGTRAFYFHEVVEQAAAHGLQYLAEADFWEMQATGFSPEVQAVLAGIEQEKGRIAREQYLDFLKGRQFRQTLLCHADRPLTHTPTAADTTGFLVGSPVRPASPAPNLRPGVAEQFRGLHGSMVRIDLPLAKAAILEIGAAWPDRLAFEDVLTRAERRLASVPMPGGQTPGSDESRRLLADVVFDSYRVGLVQLHTWKPALAPRAGARPALSRLARLQAAGDDGPAISTLLQDFVVVEAPLPRQLLRLLDGTRDRAALLASLRAWARRQPGRPGLSTGSMHDEITLESLDEKLRELARAGLIVS